MTPFGIYVDGKEAAHVPADGIVVATPTGFDGIFAVGRRTDPLAESRRLHRDRAAAAHAVFSAARRADELRRSRSPSTKRRPASRSNADGVAVDELHAGERVDRAPLPQSGALSRAERRSISSRCSKASCAGMLPSKIAERARLLRLQIEDFGSDRSAPNSSSPMVSRLSPARRARAKRWCLERSTSFWASARRQKRSGSDAARARVTLEVASGRDVARRCSKPTASKSMRASPRS